MLTPHLGASTDEAQTAVSVEACKAIVAYLKHGEIRGAVNAGGIKLDLPPMKRRSPNWPAGSARCSPACATADTRPSPSAPAARALRS